MHQEAHTQITPFNNGEFQIDMIPAGDSFKVAAPGLAKALGFAEARDMLRSIPEEEKGSEIAPTPGGRQMITIVTEAGFYRAIGNRQAARVKDENIRAQVERFQSWVYGDVLPTIRKTGSYRAPEMSRDELMARAVIFADARIKELESDNIAQAAQLEAAAPKVEYHDTFVADEDLIQFRTLANQLGIGDQALRQALAEHKWIYNHRTQRWSNKYDRLVWEPRWRCHADKRDYFRLVPNHKAPRLNGEVRQTLKITPQGATAITRALRRWGVIRPAQEELDIT